MDEPQLADGSSTYLAIVTIPHAGHAPYVVMGDREDFVADHVVELLRRHYGKGLVDPVWLAAHPYPRSQTGQSGRWLDWLWEVRSGDPKVIRIGPAPLVRATIRRPDIALDTEYQPYRDVIVRRSMFTDGELIEYTVWNRTSTVSNRFTTHGAYRRFLAQLAVELGPPRPERWGPTHLPWREDPDDQR
ncbi:hypothetical protein [Actinomadura violacea]|uniref:Uncharacterized protein n=1 Tax=Actinomadura violacea TaxID=2819934 RepID=A0ABS3S7L6_9ACTN|nr:hypothetical protein [Actinomadura violacea]MBO2464997.1 hypothetical protein [Actinomadura violacea]